MCRRPMSRSPRMIRKMTAYDRSPPEAEIGRTVT